jgi:hypothetical protein
MVANKLSSALDYSGVSAGTRNFIAITSAKLAHQLSRSQPSANQARAAIPTQDRRTISARISVVAQRPTRLASKGARKFGRLLSNCGANTRAGEKNGVAMADSGDQSL